MSAAIALVGLTLLAGCESLPPRFMNNVCPPQPTAMEGGVAYASGVQPHAQAAYYNQQMQQPLAPQPGCVGGPVADYAQPAMDPSSAGIAQQPGSAGGMMEINARLKQAQDENAALRANLTQLQAENERYGEAASRATQLATRMRTDSQHRISDLRSDLDDVESIVREQKVRHDSSLSDIEAQLNELLTEYEADLISRSALN